ncbi:chloramphenicol phosphotransferase CPT family protein [Nocardia sp. NPDC051750]|uniref:chloramphenicol phosphotransferase CPT family protein n=1 Tax=Nocardia sp. NPDC051750 TaxID=3364325 RepID=UPI0037B7B76C
MVRSTCRQSHSQFRVTVRSATMKDMNEPLDGLDSLTDTAPGQVILLNGVSSSGKSSIARQLLVDLDRPFFHMGVDMIGAMRSVARTRELDDVALAEILRRTRAGFHRAVAAMASAGNDVVMDHVLSEPWRLRDCLTVMTGLDVVFVGVRCSLGELQRREQQRGDRSPGTAAGQIAAVHAHGIYDLEVDTSVNSVEACSAQIKNYLGRASFPCAFDRLRAAAER